MALFMVVSFAFSAVNINRANAAQLQTIPGIGPKKAEDIIEYRKKNGAFKKTDELMNIKGIGAKTFEKMKKDVTVK